MSESKQLDELDLADMMEEAEAGVGDLMRVYGDIEQIYAQAANASSMIHVHSTTNTTFSPAS